MNASVQAPLISAQQSYEHQKAVTAAALAAGGGSHELVLDATWKKIQQNTFTRWINQQLKVLSSSILDLESDLCDGIQLIKLAQVLSGKNIARYNKQPNMRTQKLDNVSLVLRFFQEEEGIKIVNIDSTHIVDQNLKLILGLIWTLILHYSISQPTLSTTDQTSASSTATSNEATPRQRLMAWVKSKLPADAPVTNFTSDWNDGLALGGLVNACVPGACADWRQWRPDEALQNTLKAMRAAEDNLGIGRLITPEELINPKIDEKSIMTYLSQFPRAKPQSRGRISGVEESPMVGQTTHFFVDVDSQHLQPIVQVFDPQGNSLMPVSVQQNTAFPTRYDTSFVPKQVGKHKINVTLAEKLEAESTGLPPNLQLKLNELTVNAVAAPSLTGLTSPAELGEQQKFRINNVDEDRQLDVLVVDPQGKEVVVECSECVGNSRVCRYRPQTTGLHSVNVFLDKRHIPESPFPLRVTAPVADNAFVWGRGVCPEGTCAGDELFINVDNSSSPVNVIVTNKEGLLVPVTQHTSPHNSKPNQTSRQTFSYIPRSAGPFTVEVKSGGGSAPETHLGQSPYKIKVGPRNESTIRAIGPGLEGGIAGHEAPFYVDTKGNTNLLEFSIEGPSKTEIQCVDNGDGTAVVEYTPTSIGRYVVNVLNDGNHIKDSPFIVMVEGADKGKRNSSPTSSDQKTPLQIRASGFEEWNKSTVGDPFKFSIAKANNLEGKLLDVVVYDPQLKIVDSVKKNSTSTAHNFSFLPEKPGKHVISVTTEDGVAVAGWPFPVVVRPALELSHLRVFGPGVGSNVQQDQKTSFTIDSRQVGSNDVEALITDIEGLPTSVELVEDNSGLFTASYTPTKVGEYKIKVLVEREPTFDIKIDVGAAVKAVEDNSLNGKDGILSTSHQSLRKKSSSVSSNRSSNGTLKGKQYSHGRTTAEEQQITPARVQLAKEIPQTIVGHEASLFLKLSNGGSDLLSAKIKAPDGNVENILIEPHQKDQYKVSFFPNQPGLHSISVLQNDDHIDGSPFQVPVGLLGSAEAHRAKATGDGLLSGEVNKLESFHVSAGSVGAGELSVTIDGPSKADVVIKDEGDGNCKVDYSVTEPGLYEIFVKFNDADITDSPFRVFIKPQTSPTTSPITNHSQNENKSGLSHFTPSAHLENNGRTPVDSSINHGQWKKLAAENQGEEVPPLQPVNENAHLKAGQVYDGDARKVVAEGAGLKEFYPGQPASFTIDTANAGTNLLFVGVVTSTGPSDEVFVKHLGRGYYQISYQIPEASKALVFVKYGEAQISGSPFNVASRI